MRKLLLALCVLVTSAGLGMGSSGFSSVSADRAVTVDVVSDEDAYMSLKYSNETVDANETINFVTVSNHFAEDVSVTIQFTVDTTDELTVSSSSDITEENVDTGKNIEGTVTLDCDSDSPSQNATINFGVMADSNGDGVSAETTAERTVEYHVICHEDSTD